MADRGASDAAARTPCGSRRARGGRRAGRQSGEPIALRNVSERSNGIYWRAGASVKLGWLAGWEADTQGGADLRRPEASKARTSRCGTRKWDAPTATQARKGTT